VTEKLNSLRPECLLPADAGWQAPTPEEIRGVLARTEMSGGQVARFLGLGEKGGRAVRRWVGGEADIPFSAWALLCEKAGYGLIWHDANSPPDAI
jgi:hypothetical protein